MSLSNGLHRYMKNERYDHFSYNFAAILLETGTGYKLELLELKYSNSLENDENCQQPVA